MLGPDDLVLCAGTLPQATLYEKIDAASSAGFQGISIFYDDYVKARKQGASVAELRSRLDDAGIQVAEVDPLLDWVPNAGISQTFVDGTPDFARASEANLLELAEAVGARSLNCVLIAAKEVEVAVISEAFAALCARAREHDLLVHLEFLPWTQIRDIPTAIEIVEAAGAPNGGIMFDTWHQFRSGASNDVIGDCQKAKIIGVQINDAPSRAGADLVKETLTERRVPGQGDIDLVDIVKRLDAIGSTAPIGVEVFSSELATRPAAEVAQQCADAAREVLRQARG